MNNGNWWTTGHYYLRVLIFAFFAIKKNPRNLKTAKFTPHAAQRYIPR